MFLAHYELSRAIKSMAIQVRGTLFVYQLPTALSHEWEAPKEHTVGLHSVLPIHETFAARKQEILWEVFKNLFCFIVIIIIFWKWACGMDLTEIMGDNSINAM